MTAFIFLGDMIVMAFMVGVAIWFGTRGGTEEIAAIAEIPLHDDALPSDMDQSKEAQP